MRIEMEREFIKELSKELLGQGLRVFISSNGTYGFYTDEKGTRVVCFNIYYTSIKFFGNYSTDKPQQTGTGWVITDDVVSDYRELLYTNAPQWALSGATSVKYSSLEQHLKRYGSSSGYKEVTKEDFKQGEEA